MRNKILVMTAVLGSLMATPAAAVTNFTTNFDSFVLGSPGYATFASLEGWSSGPLGIEVQSGGNWGSPDTGTNLIELDTSANSSMFRNIDAGIYTLDFAYSARPGVAAASNGIGVFLDGAQIGSFSGNGTGRTDTNWLAITLDFTATTAGVLSFAALGASDGVGGYLDSISLVGSALPVPEPGEWAMLAAGLGVVGFVGSRRRARAA